MHLYLLTQETNNDWDTYDGAVVAADTEEEARQIHPSSDFPYRETWAAPSDVQVRLLGDAVAGTTRGVILASFNAG